MTTYKGNAGNLMQHWTLCELVTIAGKHVLGLSFIDAYAMAPHAHTRTDSNRRFDRVRDNLPGKRSVYERAWHQQAPKSGYPNSAAFVDQIWEGDFSMLLCEVYPPTIAELHPWLEVVNGSNRCKNTELFPGDWRRRFEQVLPSPVQVGLPDGSLTLVSFDPNKYDPIRRFHDRERDYNPDLYWDDIEERVLPALRNVEGGVIIQLSTYSTARGAIPQAIARWDLAAILRHGHLEERAVVSANREMMSLVYTRDVPWAHELADLPSRFDDWRPR